MKKLSVQALCHLAMLVALEVVLNRFASIQTPFLKIGFNFIPVIMGAMLYGPMGGAVVGGLGEFVGATLFPFGPYHPGFSVCGALMGVMYGLFLYQNRPGREKPRLFPNILVPVIVNCVVFALLLNTLWISQLYDSKSYIGYFVSRIPQEVGMGVVKIVLIPMLAPIAKQIGRLCRIRTAEN